MDVSIPYRHSSNTSASLDSRILDRIHHHLKRLFDSPGKSIAHRIIFICHREQLLNPKKPSVLFGNRSEISP